MVTIDQAVKNAQNSLSIIMPSFISLEPEVEEFRLSEESDEWIITFRAKNPDPTEQGSGMGSVFIPFVEKVVAVSASNGSVVAVRNPSFAY